MRCDRFLLSNKYSFVSCPPSVPLSGMPGCLRPGGDPCPSSPPSICGQWVTASLTLFNSQWNKIFGRNNCHRELLFPFRETWVCGENGGKDATTHISWPVCSNPLHLLTLTSQGESLLVDPNPHPQPISLARVAWSCASNFADEPPSSPTEVTGSAILTWS